jgi:hypothetical protein
MSAETITPPEIKRAAPEGTAVRVNRNDMHVQKRENVLSFTRIQNKQPNMNNQPNYRTEQEIEQRVQRATDAEKRMAYVTREINSTAAAGLMRVVSGGKFSRVGLALLAKMDAEGFTMNELEMAEEMQRLAFLGFVHAEQAPDGVLEVRWI